MNGAVAAGAEVAMFAALIIAIFFMLWEIKTALENLDNRAFETTLLLKETLGELHSIKSELKSIDKTLLRTENLVSKSD